jgi:hypothetical protein
MLGDHVGQASISHRTFVEIGADQYDPTITEPYSDTEREGEENTAAIGATSPRNRDGQTLAVRRHSQRDDWGCTEISDWCRTAASPRIRESHERLAE